MRGFGAPDLERETLAELLFFVGLEKRKGPVHLISLFVLLLFSVSPLEFPT